MFNSRKIIAAKKHELEGLHQRLKALEQDYSATSKNLEYTTLSSKNYNDLERKLTEINKKMTEIAQCRDNLTEEIFQLRLNELSDDIQQVIKRLITLGNCIALQTIEEAYRDVTQRAFPEIVRDLLLDLAEMAGEGEEDKNKPLWLFVKALRQKPSLIEYQKQELERLLQEHNILEELNVRDRTNAKIENYLMVTIQYDPGSERCGLQAKLIIDEDAEDLEFKPSRVETLDLPPNNANDLSDRYVLKGLSEVLGKLIKKALLGLRQYWYNSDTLY
jgi:hypothetical protein